MLTSSENEFITQVGPGTPGGEMLRRYWHPICPASELTETKRTRRVLLLGERLVLYRDLQDRYGLVAEQCSHRRASLYYAYIEEEGIRCAYHGWLYANTGECLEQPFEPKQETTRRAFQHPAYPVQKLGGLLFGYLGPEPVPQLPPWDVLAREDGTRTLEIHKVLDCNWVQCQENSLDPTHNYYLHAKRMVEKGIRKPSSLRAPDYYTFQEFPLGLIKRNAYGSDGQPEWAELGHPAVFPNMLRHVVERRAEVSGDPSPKEVASLPIDLQIRVPLDDTHTQVIVVDFFPSKDGSRGEGNEDPPVTYLDNRDESGEYHLSDFPSQDEMAWETQGPVTDRTVERLGVADTGLVMWRRLIEEQIRVVQDGGDPMGTFRDLPPNAIIDLGPSREWNGERYEPKDWPAWGNGRVWTSPRVWLGHEAVGTR